jgi:hypothetical protein
MWLFDKREKRTVDELGLALLHTMAKSIATEVEHLIAEPAFSDLNNDKDKLFQELLMLSFWSLQYLRYPEDIIGCVISHYLKAQNLSMTEKQNLLELIDNRLKTYSDGWKSGREKVLLYLVAVNISYIADRNPFVLLMSEHHISKFFSAMIEANDNYLIYILRKFIF